VFDVCFLFVFLSCLKPITCLWCDKHWSLETLSCLKRLLQKKSRAFSFADLP